ncbi:transport permease protein [Gemmatimonadetes bacterium T265]|nr:transport permease protein [Gemmatimonadetes bacterium T265]
MSASAGALPIGPPGAERARAEPAPGAAAPADRAEYLIAPPPRWPRPRLAELWTARDLLRFLVWRDVKVRYAQTALGAGWAVLQPVMAMVVFTVIFGRFARVPSDGAPYAAFSLAALVPWTFFASALTGASNSLVLHTHLLTKIYLPRLTIPVSPVLAALIDFGVAFVVLLLLLAGYRIAPSPWTVVMLPVLLLLVATTAAGVGSWLAALHVQYRDVRHLAPFLLQVWMYASPVVYPTTIVPRRYRLLYALNPMAGVIDTFRALLLGTGPVPWTELLVGGASGAVMLAGGVLYFRHVERVFADVA